jgi:hypothetical protein
MWRRLLAAAHPDRGGDHDLFIWARALYDHVAGDGPGTPDMRAPHGRREPPPHPSSPTGARVPFEAAFEKAASFADLTRQAVALAESADPVYAPLLRLLASCYEASEADGPLFRHQRAGATYRSLAAIAYAAGFDKERRVGWYRLAESVPLSQRHAGHILSKLQRGT